jgi:hypothetical protein
MGVVLYVVLAVIAVAALVLLLRHFRKQRDFEYSDHVVPEDYE